MMSARPLRSVLCFAAIGIPLILVFLKGPSSSFAPGPVVNNEHDQIDLLLERTAGKAEDDRISTSIFVRQKQRQQRELDRKQSRRRKKKKDVLLRLQQRLEQQQQEDSEQGHGMKRKKKKPDDEDDGAGENFPRRPTPMPTASPTNFPSQTPPTNFPTSSPTTFCRTLDGIEYCNVNGVPSCTGNSFFKIYMNWTALVILANGTEVPNSEFQPNPDYNQSTAPNWNGVRYPYIGAVHDPDDFTTVVGFDYEMCTVVGADVDGQAFVCPGTLSNLYGCSGSVAFVGTYVGPSGLNENIISGGVGDFAGAKGFTFDEWLGIENEYFRYVYLNYD